MDQLCHVMHVERSAVVQHGRSFVQRVPIAVLTHVPLSGFRLIYFYSVAKSVTDSENDSVDTRSV